MIYKFFVSHIVHLMDSLVRPMYISGCDFIEAFQINYRGWETPFLAIDRLSQPWVAYFIIFPFMYYYSMRLGLRLIWAAAITEYVCIIFKVILHGHRPYWYITESTYHMATPKIKQADGWACDITPATPSDRTMISACISFILVQHHCRCKGYTAHCNWHLYALAWGMHYAFQALIILSGAYLATTFPHQALIGTIMGTLMAARLSKTDILAITFKGYCWVVLVMMGIFFLCQFWLWYMGYDTTWSVTKASLACVKLSWIDTYRNKMVITAFRVAGFVTGVGLSLRFFTADKLKITDGCLVAAKLVHGLVGATVICLLDVFLQPSINANSTVYYTFLFIKYTVPPLLIITEVPFITGVAKLIICELVLRSDQTKYAEMLGGDPMIPEVDFDRFGRCVPSPVDGNECCISPSPDKCITHPPKTRIHRSRSRKKGK